MSLFVRNVRIAKPNLFPHNEYTHHISFWSPKLNAYHQPDCDAIANSKFLPYTRPLVYTFPFALWRTKLHAIGFSFSSPNIYCNLKTLCASVNVAYTTPYFITNKVL